MAYRLTTVYRPRAPVDIETESRDRGEQLSELKVNSGWCKAERLIEKVEERNGDSVCSALALSSLFEGFWSQRSGCAAIFAKA